MQVGDRVHLHNLQGCFTVHEVNRNYFVIMKHRKPIQVTYDNFRCNSGEGTSKEAIEKRNNNFKKYLAYIELYGR